jgi:hypothetical protein
LWILRSNQRAKFESVLMFVEHFEVVEQAAIEEGRKLGRLLWRQGGMEPPQ